MKKVIFIILIGFAFTKLEAQIISPELITSTGDYYYNPTATLSFSEGVVVDQLLFQLESSIKSISDWTNSIRIYPNPASTIVSIEIPQYDATISILNLQGLSLKSLVANADCINIDISNLAKGLYIITVRDKGTISGYKFIKE